MSATFESVNAVFVCVNVTNAKQQVVVVECLYMCVCVR